MLIRGNTVLEIPVKFRNTCTAEIIMKSFQITGPLYVKGFIS